MRWVAAAAGVIFCLSFSISFSLFHFRSLYANAVKAAAIEPTTCSGAWSFLHLTRRTATGISPYFKHLLAVRQASTAVLLKFCSKLNLFYMPSPWEAGHACITFSYKNWVASDLERQNKYGQDWHWLCMYGRPSYLGISSERFNSGWCGTQL